MSDKNALDLWHERDSNDKRGTSTSDDEATLRDIGRAAFGIDYPRDVTPKRAAKRHPSHTPGETRG